MKNLVKWSPFRALSIWEPFSVWEPFWELEDTRHRLISLLNRPLPLLEEFPKAGELRLATWTPRVDVVEDDKEYLINVELPGVKKDEIKVSVKDRVLSILGERQSDKVEKVKKHHRTERTYGAFVRTFTLPEDASGENLKADFEDGVLKIHIPKEVSAKTKVIDVKVS